MKRKIALGPGAASLILIVVALSLAMMAMLTIIAAKNDYSLCSRSASMIEQVYALNAASEKRLSELDAVVAKAAKEQGGEAFLKKLREGDIGILEEIVIQHPKMASLCPTSVNTCRIATLLGDKQQGIVYAFLRIGNGKVMDNVDCGGMAARINLETGKLLTVGADKQGNTFIKHPMTNTSIIGFQIPFWEEAKQMCLDAAQKIPEMRFIAWDVAITEKGPTFIEGNSFPSHAIPQFAAHYPDGIGILPEFEKFIDL